MLSFSTGRMINTLLNSSSGMFSKAAQARVKANSVHVSTRGANSSMYSTLRGKGHNLSVYLRVKEAHKMQNINERSMSGKQRGNVFKFSSF